MTVEIPPEFAEFVQSVIDSGSCRSEAEVVGEALQLLKKREQLRRDVNAGMQQLAQGQGVEGEGVFERLERKANAIADRATAEDE